MQIHDLNKSHYNEPVYSFRTEKQNIQAHVDFLVSNDDTTNCRVYVGQRQKPITQKKRKINRMKIREQVVVVVSITCSPNRVPYKKSRTKAHILFHGVRDVTKIKCRNSRKNTVLFRSFFFSAISVDRVRKGRGVRHTIILSVEGCYTRNNTYVITARRRV